MPVDPRENCFYILLRSSSFADVPIQHNKFTTYHIRNVVPTLSKVILTTSKYLLDLPDRTINPQSPTSKFKKINKCTSANKDEDGLLRQRQMIGIYMVGI